MRIKQRENSDYWVLKCDIKKFFYSIDPNILYKILEKKIKRKVTLYNKLWKANKLDFKRTIASMNSWFAHANHCNSYKLQQNILKKSEFIFSIYTHISTFDDDIKY